MMNQDTVLKLPKDLASGFLRSGRLLPSVLLSAVTHVPTKPGYNPVLVIPGLLNPPFTMAFVKRQLQLHGYVVYDAPFWINRGSFERQGERLLQLLREIAQKHGCPVDIVGWSMGGRYALRMAEIEPGLIGKIISFGSPIVHDDIDPWLESVWRLHLTANPFTTAAAVEREMLTPLELPHRDTPFSALTAVGDSIVSKKSSMIPANRVHKKALRENILVDNGHLSLGFSHQVADIVLERLSQPSDLWTPYTVS